MRAALYLTVGTLTCMRARQSNDHIHSVDLLNFAMFTAPTVLYCCVLPRFMLTAVQGFKPAQQPVEPGRDDKDS